MRYATVERRFDTALSTCWQGRLAFARHARHPQRQTRVSLAPVVQTQVCNCEGTASEDTFCGKEGESAHIGTHRPSSGAWCRGRKRSPGRSGRRRMRDGPQGGAASRKSCSGVEPVMSRVAHMRRVGRSGAAQTTPRCAPWAPSRLGQLCPTGNLHGGAESFGAHVAAAEGARGHRTAKREKRGHGRRGAGGCSWTLPACPCPPALTGPPD